MGSVIKILFADVIDNDSSSLRQLLPKDIILNAIVGRSVIHSERVNIIPQNLISKESTTNVEIRKIMSEKEDTQTIMSILRNIDEATVDELALIGAAIRNSQNFPKFKVQRILDRGVRCGFIRKDHERKYKLSDHHETDGGKRKRAKKNKRKAKQAKRAKGNPSESDVETEEETESHGFVDDTPEPSTEERLQREQAKLRRLIRNVLDGNKRRRRGVAIRMIERLPSPSPVLKEGEVRNRKQKNIRTEVAAPNRGGYRKIEGYRPRKIDFTVNGPN